MGLRFGVAGACRVLNGLEERGVCKKAVRKIQDNRPNSRRWLVGSVLAVGATLDDGD
jgi:hypothetical protein